MTNPKIIVRLPDPVKELAHEVSNTGRARSKGWLKSLTGVDKAQTNGYAFLGDFLHGSQAELSVGSFVLGFGADRHGNITVALWQVTSDGLQERKMWENLGSPWALGCRDEIAAIVSTTPSLDALRAEREQLLARLAEIDARLSPVPPTTTTVS